MSNCPCHVFTFIHICTCHILIAFVAKTQFADTVTPAPETTLEPPYVLPTLPPDRPFYGETTDGHFGNILEEFEPFSDGTPFETEDSPFGFGTGAVLENKHSQCLKKENFVEADMKCIIDPKDCEEGLSFAIWAKTIFSDNIFDEIDNSVDDNRKYAMSTGGDSEGHPGISVYTSKAWLVAEVSTGENYWQVKVLGPMSNNTWTNLGVRFKENDFGIELYVDSILVGTTKYPIATTPQPGFDPPSLTLGCSMTHDDPPQLMNFADTVLDEVAFWNKCVDAADADWFMGGYVASTDKMDLVQLYAELDNIDVSLPGQFDTFADIAKGLVAKKPPSEDKSTPTTGDTYSGSDSSMSSDESTDDVVNLEEGANDFFGLASIVKKLVDSKKVPRTISAEGAEKMLDVLNTVSDLFSEKNNKNWISVHSMTEKVGIMQFINEITKWKSQIYKNIPWTNETHPDCDETLAKNLYSKICKMTMRQFQNMGDKVLEPDHNQPHIKAMVQEWDRSVKDYLAFPPIISKEEICLDRAITYDFTKFVSLTKTAQANGSPVIFSETQSLVVDSSIMSITLTPDVKMNEYREVLPEESLCEPDYEIMKKSPVVMKFENEIEEFKRKNRILFKDFFESTVEERFCVWWNENISDIGAWDTTGCKTIQVNAKFTECACQHSGIFTVLAVLLDPIEVPDEPGWLTKVKYILSIISTVAVLLYIVVVAISGDLKDQFHIIGANLAIAIMCGSITMLISDFDTIRDDRGSNAIVGAMIQVFYGAVGTFMLGLSHASFRAITAGVIGGHLKSYILLCWGAPIALAGLPFIIFEPKHLGNDPRCFVAWDTMVKLIFFAPQTLCAVLGLFFAFVVLFNLSTPALRKDNLIEDYGTFCQGAALLVMLLSLTWIFAIFAYLPILDEPDFYPIFQVLNSIAGICLLIFIGFGSTRFKSFILGKAKFRRAILKKHAFGVPDTSPPSTVNEYCE